MRTALAGFHLEGNGGSWNPGAGGDGWSGGGGGCGGDCGCGGQCGGDCGCKGGGGACGGKPSGGCGGKPSGGCGGKPSDGGGGLGGGSGQLPLMPEYDGEIWDWRGNPLLGNGDGNWGGGGGLPDTVPDPTPVPDMLTQGRCTRGGRDWRPECGRTSCCCLDKVCVQALPQDIIQLAGITQALCPVKFTKHFRRLENEGNSCSMKMHEFDLGSALMATGLRPRGYLEWNLEDWNNTANHSDWSSALRDFEANQLADAGSSSIPDNIHMSVGVQFAQFLEIKSGCQDPGCLDCCVMLFAKAVGSEDASECRISVRAKCAPSGRLVCERPSVKTWPGSPYKDDYFTPESLHDQFTHGNEWKSMATTKKANGLVVGDCVS